MGLFCCLGWFAVHKDSTYYGVANTHHACVSQPHAHYFWQDKAFSNSGCYSNILYPPWFCPGKASPLTLRRGGPGSVHRRGEPNNAQKCSRFSNFLQFCHAAWYTQSGFNLANIIFLPIGDWDQILDSQCTCIYSHVFRKTRFPSLYAHESTAASTLTPGVKAASFHAWNGNHPPPLLQYTSSKSTAYVL